MTGLTRPGSRVALLPLERFDREELRRPLSAEGTTRNGRAPLPVMRSLLARHFAGYADAPSPRALWRALRAPEVGRESRGALYNLFGSMRFPEYRELVFDAGLPLYELARAMGNARIAPVTATRWLNQFARSDGAGERERKRSTRAPSSLTGRPERRRRLRPRPSSRRR